MSLSWSLYLSMVFYVVSGIGVHLTSQTISNHMQMNWICFVAAILMCRYSGMTAIAALSQGAIQKSFKTSTFLPSPLPPDFFRNMFYFSFFDVAIHILSFLSLNLIGSGVQMMIYSSSVYFTAALASFFSVRQFSRVQMYGISVVTVGIVVLSFGTIHDMAQLNPNSSGAVAGVLAAVVSTGLTAVNYVYSEYLFTTKWQYTAVSPLHTSFWGGIFGLSFVVFTSSMYFSQNECDVAGLMWHLSGLVCMYGVHLAAYFHVIMKVGSVAVGLLQAVRAEVVFFLSAFFFCDIQPSQCLTLPKIVGAFAISIGIAIYIHSSSSTDRDVLPLTKNKESQSA